MAGVFRIYCPKQLIHLSALHLSRNKSYCLFCVLEVVSATKAGDNSNTSAMVTVFDGYEDWTVPISQCCIFRKGELELKSWLLCIQSIVLTAYCAFSIQQGVVPTLCKCESTEALSLFIHTLNQVGPREWSTSYRRLTQWRRKA